MPQEFEIVVLVVRMLGGGTHDGPNDALLFPLEQWARRGELDARARVAEPQTPVSEVVIESLANLKILEPEDCDRRPLVVEPNGNRIVLQQRVG